MGFGAQIKALQEAQRSQADRIAMLERENTLLKASRAHSPDLLLRIEALEQHNAHLTARRKEAVAQLLNLRTLHQEANNAFAVRTTDIQPDDLEAMLAAYGTSMTTVLNQHARALGQMRSSGQLPAYGTPFLHVVGCYPPSYSQIGYCHAHQIPYPCGACGN